MDKINEVMELIERALYNANRIAQFIKNGPYGIIHKQAFIEYNGKKAKLVWDYVLWNELTVEVFNTVSDTDKDVNTVKYSIAEKISDSEMEKMFNEILEKYPLKN